MSLLDPLHKRGCDGTEYSACRPVATGRDDVEVPTFEVVYVAWCGECGAADYETV